MKLNRKLAINIILIIGIGLVLFTPVRAILGGLWSKASAFLKTELNMSLEGYDWQLVDINGNPYNFKEAQGKVVLVNFWATWCAPCIAEMPSLQNLYDDYGDKVAFLFVAEDKLKKVSAFIEKHGFDLPIYFSESDGPSLLTAKTLPTTYVIDKNGKIIVAETGSADWNSDKVRKLLNELIAESKD